MNECRDTLTEDRRIIQTDIILGQKGTVNIEGRIENQLLDWPVGDPSGISGTDYTECSIKVMNRRGGQAERERERESDADVRCSQKPKRDEIDY